LEFSLNEGFLSLTNEGIRVDFAPDLPDTEQQTLAVTQGSRIWHAGDREAVADFIERAANGRD